MPRPKSISISLCQIVDDDDRFSHRSRGLSRTHCDTLLRSLMSRVNLDPMWVWDEVDNSGIPTGKLILMDGRHRLAALKAKMQANVRKGHDPQWGKIMIKTEWFGIYDHPPLRSRYEGVMQSWDTASVPGDANDYSVCTTWGFLGERIELLDFKRGKYGMLELQIVAGQLAEKWNPNLIVIEATHSGFALIQHLRSKGVRGVRSSTPKHTKEECMAARTPLLASGNVCLPRNAPWRDAFLDECAAFPNGKHDDQVDTLPQMLMAVLQCPGELRHLSRYR